MEWADPRSAGSLNDQSARQSSRRPGRKGRNTNCSGRELSGPAAEQSHRSGLSIRWHVVLYRSTIWFSKVLQRSAEATSLQRRVFNLPRQAATGEQRFYRSQWHCLLARRKILVRRQLAALAGGPAIASARRIRQRNR